MQKNTNGQKKADDEPKPDIDPATGRFKTWKETLGVNEPVEGKKKCLVCNGQIDIANYVAHVKSHERKEPRIPIIFKESEEFLKAHDGLIIKSNLPLIREDAKEFQDIKHMETDDLFKLLSDDYLVESMVFYIQPGVKLHQNLSYDVSVNPKPFL